MDWRNLERLCGDIFQMVGYDVEDTGKGSDGGIDLVCRNAASTFAVQCKRWKKAIPVTKVRQLRGSIEPRGIERAVFITSGDYTRPCIDEYAHTPLTELVNGRQLLEGIRDLGESNARHLLQKWIQPDDWDIPSCASHGIKMIVRHKGNDRSNLPFWGCPKYTGSGGCRTPPGWNQAFPIREHHLIEC